MSVSHKKAREQQQKTQQFPWFIAAKSCEKTDAFSFAFSYYVSQFCPQQSNNNGITQQTQQNSANRVKNGNLQGNFNFPLLMLIFFY